MKRTSTGSERVGTASTVSYRPRRDKRSRAGGRPGWRRTGLALLALLLAAAPATGQIAPDTPWRSLTSARFITTFPAGLEPEAERATRIAEAALARLELLLGPGQPGRIEILLTDDTDASNGSARVAPWRQVVVFARPPVDGFALSAFDDWFRLVITHELVHILHLDRTGTPGHLVRSLFGRVPASWPAFPGFSTPGWVIEGLATWLESRETGSGRVIGTDFRMLLRTAALAGSFEDLGAASGDSQAWPAGQRRYVYGALFFDWLARRYGEAAVVDFIDRVAQAWIPWRMEAAAKGAFGTTFEEAWSAWSTEIRAEAETADDALGGWTPEAVEVVTPGTQWAIHARARGERVGWIEFEGTDDPRLRVRTTGEGGGREWSERVNGFATFDLLPEGGAVVAQQEFDGPWRTRTDLWLLSPEGDRRRVTRNARVDHPSLFPDGRRVAAIRYRSGGTDLVTVELDGGTVTPLVTGSIADGDARILGFPAVSPSGEWIAASLWDGAGSTRLILLDAETGAEIDRLDGPVGERAIAPVWAGPGRIVVGSDRTGISQLWEIGVSEEGSFDAEPRLRTAVVTGARFPAVDGTGRLWFSHHHAAGWEMAHTQGGVPLPTLAPRIAGAELPPPEDLPLGEEPLAASAGYAPWRTLSPRYWELAWSEAETAGATEVVGPFFGGATVLQDLVGRHRVDVEVTADGGGRLAGGAAWRWAGLGNPLVGLRISQGWEGRGPLAAEDESGVPTSLFIRERVRSAGASVALLRNRWWTRASIEAEVGWVGESRQLLDAELRESHDFRLRRPTSDLGRLVLRGRWSSVRSAPLSISAEEGVSIAVDVQRLEEFGLADSIAGVRGLDRSRDEGAASLRAYRSFDGPGFSDHVLALRATLAGGRGPGSSDVDYDVGGAFGRSEPFTGLGLFGRSAPFPVRGYPRGARLGWAAWSTSLEYRLPIALVNRGPGLVPLHLDRVHGALFFDAGGTRRRDSASPPAIHSIGAELRTAWLLFWDTGIDLHVGVAAPTAGDGPGPSIYLRLGTLF